jgi:hypothetical protein
MVTRRALGKLAQAQAVVGGGIADHMQADRFVRIELTTLRTHLT